MSKSILFAFFQSFMVSSPTFRFLIHFLFAFIYNTRKQSSFIILYVAVQFSQHHLLKRLSFIIFIFLPTRSQNQFSSVIQSCPILCDPMNHNMPGYPVQHQLPKFIQTLVHQVGDATQPSHSLSSPSPSALNLSQHQALFQ